MPLSLIKYSEENAAIDAGVCVIGGIYRGGDEDDLPVELASKIVRCVNAHDDLLAAAELGLEWLDDCTPETIKDQIQAAINKARNG